MAPVTLPLGFRFRPTDEELVYYLKKKINRPKIELEIIPEVDVYKCEPWDVPAKSNLPGNDREWYFFSPRDRKYLNGSRTKRATQAGYWNATGKDRKVNYQRREVGVKKTLVYYRGRAPNGSRTSWVMHEYCLDERGCEGATGMQDAYVLCRVFNKSALGPRIIDDNDASYGGPWQWVFNGHSSSGTAVVCEGSGEDMESCGDHHFSPMSTRPAAIAQGNLVEDTGAPEDDSQKQFLSRASPPLHCLPSSPCVPSKVYLFGRQIASRGHQMTLGMGEEETEAEGVDLVSNEPREIGPLVETTTLHLSQALTPTFGSSGVQEEVVVACLPPEDPHTLDSEEINLMEEVDYEKRLEPTESPIVMLSTSGDTSGQAGTGSTTTLASDGKMTEASLTPPLKGVEPLVMSEAFETPVPIEISPSKKQVTKHAPEEAPNEVLGIEWPSVAPFRPRFIIGLAEDLLGQLHDLIDRRPLPSWSVGREFLRLATLSYHAMGFTQEPWMAALERTWVEFSRLKHQEFERHKWLAEVLPQIHALDEELKASKRQVIEMTSELAELHAQEMALDDHMDTRSMRIQMLLAEYQSLLEEEEADKRVKDTVGKRIQDAEGCRDDHLHHEHDLEDCLTLLWDSRPTGVEKPH